MPDMVQAQRLEEPTDQPDEVMDQPVESPDYVAGLQRDPVMQRDRLTKQSEWSNWAVLAMIALCFFVIVHFRPFDSRRPQDHDAVGKRLSRLALQPLLGEGRPLTLGDLTGRVVLLNFWGPWSSPGREALTPLAAMEREFRSQPAFQLLAVACAQETHVGLSTLRRDTEACLRRQKIQMAVYADQGEMTRSAIDDVVGFHDVPTTLVIDRRGRIRGVWIGYQPGVEADMRQLVVQLLAEG